MKNLKDFDFNNKKVLVRCDFNVPLDKRGKILDDFRIKEVIPTIKYLIKEKAKIILMSHLGRPEGKVIEELRLGTVAKRLSSLLGKSIKKLNTCVGAEVEEAIKNICPGGIVLLENIQFDPGEKKNSPVFAKTLAGYGDVFVMEAFGQVHRNYASIAGIPRYLPSCAGFLLEKEIKSLDRVVRNPKRPLVAIIGGAKVETKAALIDKFSRIADYVLIGGLIKREIENKKIKLKNPRRIIRQVEPVEGKFKYDIGPATIKIFKEKIKSAKTIFFAGVLGQIERKKFQKGTEEILKAIMKSKAFSVIGGGEMVEFVNKLGIALKFSHISTGGGAMLTFLAGEKLFGIEALK